MLKSIVEKIKRNPMGAMALCCVVPLIAVVILSYLKILPSWGLYALLLLCPLGHIWMMRGMFRSPEKTQMSQGVKQLEHK